MQEIARYFMLGENDHQVVVIEWTEGGARRLITKDGRTVKYIGNGRYLLLGQTEENLRPNGPQPLEPRRLRGGPTIEALKLSPKQIAIHESGHAIVGHALGFEVRTIRVVPGKEGEVQWPWNLHDLYPYGPELAAGMLACYVAGWVASLMDGWGKLVSVSLEEIDLSKTWELSDEALSAYIATALWARDKVKKGGFYLSSGEAHLAWRTGKLRTSDGVIAEVKRAERRAQAILKKNWPAVESLARALMRKPLLEGPGLAKLLRTRLF